jgi:Tol biopolymer transport system component
VRVTHQTSVVQTPTLSPEGTEVAYLSDAGGHANVWITRTDGSGARQITFERDSAKTIGVPVWSPAGRQIAFVFAAGGVAGQWLINSDGSGSRQFTSGLWAYWSADGSSMYVSEQHDGKYCIDRVSLEDGRHVQVRCDNAIAPELSPDGRTLYYASSIAAGAAGFDFEIRKATPETAPSTVIARVSGSRIPVDTVFIYPLVSPDGRSLVQPLVDGTTTNLWAIPSDGGPLRPLTDFGDRSLVIARRYAWAHDGKSIYAAIADIDSDIVRLDGLIR